MNQYKTCTRCLQNFPFDFFHKKTSRKDGHSSHCKACASKNRGTRKPYFLYTELEKEKNRAKSRAWNKANKAKRTQSMAKRRAEIRKSSVYLITAKEIKRLQKKNCFYCGSRAKEIDHVIPLARGGSHSIGNLVAACRACNSSKNKQFVMEWRIKKGRPPTYK